MYFSHVSVKHTQGRAIKCVSKMACDSASGLPSRKTISASVMLPCENENTFPERPRCAALKINNCLLSIFLPESLISIFIVIITQRFIKFITPTSLGSIFKSKSSRRNRWQKNRREDNFRYRSRGCARIRLILFTRKL